ncbi:MAG: DNA primase, partial [Ferruginibacter sp.]
KIEESGLHALVNKFIREKIGKEENRTSRDQRFAEETISSQQSNEVENDATALFNKDEIHEQAMIRSLLEFGLKDLNAEQKVADYIFKEIEDNQLEELIDNKELVRILKTYRAWYEAGIEPTAKNFLYHEDLQMSALVVSIMDFDYEISPNWAAHFEGHIATRDELFADEVFSTLNYLKLRKIKRLMDENQRDLEKSTVAEDQMMLVQTHQHLKQMEIELTKQLGTVIFR